MVREVTAADEELLYRFNSELSGRPLSREGFARAFSLNVVGRPDNRYLVAEVGGLAVGMGSCHVQWLLHHASPIAEIQELYVLPEYRSLGVGAVLIQELERFASIRQAEQVELSTNKKRIDAQRFYARQGYSDTHLKWVKKD